MLEPDEVTAMLRLRKLGWGSKRLAREFGCSRTTVKRYLGAGGWQPYQRRACGGKLGTHFAVATGSHLPKWKRILSRRPRRLPRS